MLEVQEKYRNIIALILPSLLGAVIVLESILINAYDSTLTISEFKQLNLFYSDFLSSILAGHTSHQFMMSLILLNFLSLYFLFYQIYKNFNFSFCIKSAIYIGAIYFLAKKLNGNLDDIFFFICFINIVNSFLAKLRSIKFIFLVFSIIVCPAFSIPFVAISYFLIKILRLNFFYIYKYDLVMIDSILTSILLLFFVYGTQSITLFVYRGGASPIIFIITILLFVLTGLPLLLAKKSYAT